MPSIWDDYGKPPAPAAGGMWDQYDKENPPRSLAVEIPADLYGGTTIALPQQLGQAMQWMSEPGHPVYEKGRQIVDWSEQRARENPGLQPQTEGRGVVGTALAQGAYNLPASAVPMVMGAAGGALAGPVGAIAGVTAGAAGLFGNSQAQQTYQKLLDAGVPEPDADKAAWINWFQETGGETVGDVAGMKLFGMFGKALAKAGEAPVSAAIRGATDTAIARPYLTQLAKTSAIESGTEFGQNFGEAWVENKYGANPEGNGPLAQGMQGAEAALGMTALLAPFGLAGFARVAKRNGKVADALTNPDAPQADRIAASTILYGEINKVDPDAAKAWATNSSLAIATNAPIVLDETTAQQRYGGPGQPTIHEVMADEAAKRIGDIGNAQNIDQAIAAAQAAPDAIDVGTIVKREVGAAQDGRMVLEAMEKHAQEQEMHAQQVAAENERQLILANQTEPGVEEGVPGAAPVSPAGPMTAMQMAFEAARAKKGLGPDGTPVQPTIIPTTSVEAQAATDEHLAAARNLTRSEETRQIIDEELARRAGVVGQPAAPLAAASQELGATSSPTSTEIPATQALAGKELAPTSSPTSIPTQQPAAPSPAVQQIHTLAAEKGISVDAPEFKDWTAKLTGKQHLDDMSPVQLAAVAKKLSDMQPAEAQQQQASPETDEPPPAFNDRRKAISAAKRLTRAGQRHKVIAHPTAEGQWAVVPVEEKPLSEKQIAARAASGERLRRANAARRRPNPERDSLLPWLAKRGGIHMSERADTVTEGNRNFAGMHLFTNNGSKIDMAAEAAYNDGYLTREEYSDGGGVAALREKIAEEFNGQRKHLSSYYQQSQAESAEDEVWATADAYDIPVHGLSFEQVKALVDAAVATEQLIQETDDQREARLEREAIQAQDIYPEEPDDIPGPETGTHEAAPGGSEPNIGEQPQSQEPAPLAGAEARPGERDRGDEADQEREPGQDDEGPPAFSRRRTDPNQQGFDLTAPTPEELRAQAEAQDAAAKKEESAKRVADESERKAKEKKEIAQRSQAAAGEFTLDAQVNDKAAQKAADKARAEENLSGQKPMFRQGASNPGGNIRAAVASALSHLSIPATVHDSIEQARAITGVDIPDDARGMYYNGQIHLFAENLNPLTAQETLWHEALHAGLSNLFGIGSREYEQALTRIAAQNPNIRKAAAEWRAKYGEDARARAKADGTNPDRYVTLQSYDEALADLSGRNETISGLKQFLAAVQKFLRSVGLDKLADAMEGKTDAEALALVSRARDAVMKGDAYVVRGAAAGAFSRDREPAAAFSRGVQLGELTADQTSALRNVHGDPVTWRTKLNDFKATWKKDLVQGIFDQYAPIKQYTEKGYRQTRAVKGGDSTLEALLTYGKVYVDPDGAYRVQYTKAGGLQGFAKVIASLHGEQDRFLEWVAAQRADRLKSIGLENLYSDADIAALKTLDQGDMRDGNSRAAAYAKALTDLNSWNDSVLKIAVDSGLIDQETRQLYKDVPYVPFYRLQDEGVVNGFGMKAGIVNQDAWKKLKGGTQHLNEDLLANLLQNWSHMITASAKNRAAKTVLEAAIFAKVAEEVPTGTPGKGLVSFTDAGKDRVFRVSDPHLMDAIAAMNYAGLGDIGKPFIAMKRYLTIGVTINPAFKIRNLIRDSIQAIGTADLSYNPAKNVAQGFKATAHDSETRAQLLAGGGMIRFGSMLDGNGADRARRLIEEGVDPAMILDNASKLQRFWKQKLLPAFDAYQELGDRGEQISRAALYEQLLAKGMSHEEASFWARDLLDFSLSGKWAAVRILTQIVPFMNARLQGLYKLGRATKADYKRMGTTLGVVALASIALMLAYGDDDDWKKREDWDRDNYWWFKVGGVAIRVPKPFEIGAVGTLAERSIEYMTSKEMTGKRFFDRVSSTVFNQLNMNPTPQLVKPLMDIYANKDAFTGRPIETAGMETLRKQDRATDRTSEIAKAIGSLGLPDPTQLAMGQWNTLSPVQIDALVRGYFGWLGTSTTTALDWGIRPMMDRGQRPDMKLRDVFLAGNFVESLPDNSSRYVTQLYEQAKEIEEAYGSYHNALKLGERERAAQILADEREKIQKYKAVEMLKRREGNLNTQAKRIEASKDIPGDEKRRRLDSIEQHRNELAQSLR